MAHQRRGYIRYTMSSATVLLCLCLPCVYAYQNQVVDEEEPGCEASVRTNDGIKWIYLHDDLKLIGDEQYSVSLQGRSYLWRPCKQFDIQLPQDVPLMDNSCQDSFLVWKNHDRMCFSMGHEGRFYTDSQGIGIEYSVAKPFNEKVTVRLVCNETLSPGQLTCDDNCLTYTPRLAFHSKHVCLRDRPESSLPLIHDAQRLSAGTLILIVTGFIFLTYLLTGIMRGTARGRRGLDRLPNSDFWIELPLLVKDGCCFLFLCQLPMLYRGHKKTEIYQPILHDRDTPVEHV